MQLRQSKKIGHFIEIMRQKKATNQFILAVDHFKYASTLFLDKWRAKNFEPLNDFLRYFEMEWLISNSGWYEGMYDRTPKHNNALESTNKVIKTHHTLRARLSLSHYLDNAVTMMKQWSVDRSTNEGRYNDIFDIECYYQHAYNWT